MQDEHAPYFSQLANTWMREHRVTPSPDNYRIWFTYAEGENEILVEEMDALLKSDTKLDAEVHQKLFEKHFPNLNESPADRSIKEQNSNFLAKIQRNVTHLVKAVFNSLDPFSDITKTFEGKIKEAIERIAKEETAEGVQSIAKEIANETRKVQQAAEAINEELQTVNAELTDLKKKLAKSNKEAYTDPLTGLLNRRAMDEAVPKALSSATKANPLSLFIVDIDHFKGINDNHGHIVGDMVLKFLAKTLKTKLPKDLLSFRFGGEEFLVLCPSTALAQGKTYSETIRELFEKATLKYAKGKKSLGKITLTVGVSQYQEGEEFSDFLDRADKALYFGKSQGRNQVITQNEI